MERTLRRLTRDDVQLLHGKMQLGRVKPGQALVKEGVPPLGLFIVREGSVVVKRSLAGFDRTVAVLAAGEMFGESAFISPAPFPASATVVAAEQADVIVLTPQRLAPLFEEHPGLFSRFFHSISLTLSERLRACNELTGRVGSDRYGDIPDWEIV